MSGQLFLNHISGNAKESAIAIVRWWLLNMQHAAGKVNGVSVASRENTTFQRSDNYSPLSFGRQHV
jgi:hypothetical protein